ncbi:NAD(P)-dependent oxidoreductase [Streptomyces sp. YIM 98790]|uniref:NAD(P)-dependent oxidoreductase n=1 Tax=Streptomyces sp. YIM 98790 TaxID=2689077 RepID=UPI001A9EC51D|nr:NAD(P)-dependent oxidoreductase [Streptomyces sp. YIM 98790]
MSGRLPRVAVIGLGAMGARLARNLCAGGYPVVVANRSPEPVRELAAAGASAAPCPAEAAARADVVLVVVSDDRASESVWLDRGTGVLAGAAPGTLAIEAGTLSPGWIRRLAAAAGRRGIRFLEAPMVGSRPQAEARALVHLVGGPAGVLADARGVLENSAAGIHHVGDHGTAAVLKLIVNASLGTQVAAMAELLGIARRAGLDPAETVRVLTGLPVTSPAAARAADAMTAGDFAPRFPVRLAAKDLGYLTALAGELGGDAPLTRAALAGYERAGAVGHGDDDLTAVAALHR